MNEKEEKNGIKIRLSTAILLIIILILIFALIITYYLGFVEDRKKTTIQEENRKILESSNIVNNNYENISIQSQQQLINNINSNNIAEIKTKNNSFGLNGIFTTLTDGVEPNLIGTYAFEAYWSDNKATIFALKTDGTEIKVVENVTPRDIWYDDGKLYFSVIHDTISSDTTFSYSVIDLKSSEHKMETIDLDKDIQISFVIDSIGDIIYYIDFMKDENEEYARTNYIGAYSMKDKSYKVLYKCKERGGAIRDYSIDKENNKIYFVDDIINGEKEGLYFYNLNNNQTKEIMEFKVETDDTQNEIIRDYYYKLFKNIFIYQDSEDKLLYSYNLKTGKKNVLLNDELYAKAIFKNNYLYYTTLKNGKTNIVKFDGKNYKTIYSKEIQNEYFSIEDKGKDKIYITLSNGVSEGIWSKYIDTNGKEIDTETAYEYFIIKYIE